MWVITWNQKRLGGFRCIVDTYWKSFMQHFVNMASCCLPLETQTYSVPLKICWLSLQLFMLFQTLFTFGNKKNKNEATWKSTPNAVFVRHMKKCSLPPNQELNLDAALTLYLLCTIACKLHYYFQVPYHLFWAVSVSTEMSCILILNFGAKGQPASARGRITRGLRLNGIWFV